MRAAASASASASAAVETVKGGRRRVGRGERGTVRTKVRAMVTTGRGMRVVRAGAKIDFEDAGLFELPYAPVAETLLPKGPWKVVEGGLCAAKGFKVAAHKAGLRATGTRADCALVLADEDAKSAGIFTTNVMCAAPVTVCKDQLAGKPTARALLINAGQANAATGDAGMADAKETAAELSKSLCIPEEDILLMSTGVIGKRMKMDKYMPGISVLAENVESSVAAANAAATAICTTDLVRKTVAIELEIGGKTVRMGGMAKGSGMIHPNMATMLGVVTCDAAVSSDVWRDITSRAGSASFNQISVDGDTSTNDSLVCFASGEAGNAEIVDANGAEAKLLEDALTAVCMGLAKAIAWDGEGATCLIECNVSGAGDDEDARVIAHSVICSSLAKAAIFGHDPNWGRLACAAGYAAPVKSRFSQDNLKLSLGPHQLMNRGQPLDFDAVAASRYLKEVTDVHGVCVVDISVGDGPGAGQAWGCDLSYKYVEINAEYTTATRLVVPRARAMGCRPRATITFHGERCQLADASSDDRASTSGRTAGGSLVALPLLERRPGSSRAVLRYACVDGKLRVMRPNEWGARDGEGAARRLDRAIGRAARKCAERAQHALLPEPSSVTNDYWEYAKFRFAQRIASSCISVFATQQMLTAVGLGASRTLPAAAAVNWVLKDGLGRLGKLSVAANFGRTFDSDVKRFRFTSSVVYDASSFIEIITPYFPQHFLALATVANIGKSVGITTANVVRAPIQRTFILEENLAEVAAKTSAQQVVADNIGLALAVGAASAMSKVATVRPAIRRALPVFAFGPLAALDLICIYKELKAVQLRTINKERAEIIAETFVTERKIPSRAQVANSERLLIPARLDKSNLPLSVTSIGEVCPTTKSLIKALSNKTGGGSRRQYILAYEPGASKKRVILNGRRISAPKTDSNGKKKRRTRKFPWQSKRTGLKGRALLALSETASSKDVLCAILQVAHMRSLPYRPDLTAEEAYVWALQESDSLAKRDIDTFTNSLSEQGWNHGRILFSSAERAPYSVDSVPALLDALRRSEDVKS